MWMQYTPTVLVWGCDVKACFELLPAVASTRAACLGCDGCAGEVRDALNTAAASHGCMFSISGIIGCAAFLEILHDTMDAWLSLPRLVLLAFTSISRSTGGATGNPCINIKLVIACAGTATH